MTLIELLILAVLVPFVLAPLALLVIYTGYIQHSRGGLWRVLKLLGVVGYLPDVLLAHTVFALWFGELPGPKAWTVSQHIDSIVRALGVSMMEDHDGYWYAVKLGRLLNRIDPLHNHIKSLAAEDRLLNLVNDERGA